MPSFARTLLLAAPTVLVALLLAAPVEPVRAVASPAALPMPLWSADYKNRFVPVAHATRHKANTKVNLNVSVSGSVVHHTHAHPPAQKRAAHAIYRHFRRQDLSAELDVLLGQMITQRNDAVSSSDGLQSLASQSASSDGDNSTFQQQAAAQLTSFQSSMSTFNNLFGQLGSDDGLANYDKTDQVETVLKDVVNANKNALSAITVLVYNIPTLGPILGPIVYEVKCIVDGLLDVTENLTDGLLNDLAPLLSGLLGQATSATCATGFSVLGLCL